MQSILEELYSGNIRPDSRIYAPNSPFVKAAHVKKESMDKLMDTMNGAQKVLFEEYTDAQAEIDGITRYDMFTYSFILGSTLMMEILAGREEILKWINLSCTTFIMGVFIFGAWTVLKDNPQVKEIVSCLDNDETVIRRSKKLCTEYSEKGYRTFVQPPEQKDYNEQLQKFIHDKYELDFADEMEID